MAAYDGLARRPCGAFAAGSGLVHDVLDIALIDGVPGVVELNPIRDFG